MYILCDKCEEQKKKNCKNMCETLKFELNKLNKYSLTSNYIIKFCNPLQLYSIRQRSMVYKFKNDRVDYYNIINSRLYVLSEREKKCVILYYGLDGNESIPQAKLAELLKVSQHTIVFYLKRARKKLAKELMNDIRISKLYKMIEDNVNSDIDVSIDSKDFDEPVTNELTDE